MDAPARTGCRHALRSVTAVVVVMALAAAPSGSAGRGTADVWSALRRPLKPPQGWNGSGCPTTAPAKRGEFPKSWDQDASRLYGAGPAYLMLSTERGLGVLDMRYSAIADGRRAQKSPWVVRPGYHGPLLVRAWSPSGSATVTMSIVRDQQAELRIPAGKLHARTDASGWHGFPSLTWTSRPGCIAWQVDGPTFSRVIVARALW